MPEVTENEPDGCNQGQEPEEIIAWARATFGGDFLDEQTFRLMPADWSDKSAGLYEYEESKLHLRATIARQIIRAMALKAGDDAHIVVVSHSQFLPYLTQGQGPDWNTAEWRTYAIGSDSAATLTQINL
ncbi:phosphoglycerate mutase family protein [Diaporthe helianthi]|uniref:Phosphoglycerate mutase family protein n=1 Tax=Diaporthe helianthi TaxID=158607 RepID=A0A2P5HKW4_DIAHE|nr:phosphoglycerate mutase family protein [Diaporthe helianthi]